MSCPFWCFLHNFMKNGYQLEKYKAANWNIYIATTETVTCITTIEIVMCIMHCRKHYLHDCNRGSHLHSFNKNCHPYICCRKFHPHKCCRNFKLHNCYRKCHLHTSNRNYHLQNWLQKLSFTEMVPVRDPFSYNKEI